MHIKTAKICFINFEILQSTGLFICIFQKSLKVFGAVSVNALLSTANRNSQCSIQLYKERIRVLHCEWMLSAGSIVNSTFAWWLYKYYWPTFNAGRCPTKIKGLNCHMQTIAKDTYICTCMQCMACWYNLHILFDITSLLSSFSSHPSVLQQ